jgi:hypothetical protein
MEPRRRSNAVVLTLVGLPLGAIALANAFPGQELRRNLYPDRAACERDYAPAQCQAGGSSGSGGTGSGSGGGGGYHGPYYAANRSAAAANDPGMGRSGQFTRTETSVRGGFGGFGRAPRAAS